jgi:hypothetical protein
MRRSSSNLRREVACYMGHVTWVPEEDQTHEPNRNHEDSPDRALMTLRPRLRIEMRENVLVHSSRSRPLARFELRSRLRNGTRHPVRIEATAAQRYPTSVAPVTLLQRPLTPGIAHVNPPQGCPHRRGQTLTSAAACCRGITFPQARHPVSRRAYRNATLRSLIQ